MKQLFAIKTRRAVAGIVFENDRAIETHPAYSWAVNKTIAEVRETLRGT